MEQTMKFLTMESSPLHNAIPFGPKYSTQNPISFSLARIKNIISYLQIPVKLRNRSKFLNLCIQDEL